MTQYHDKEWGVPVHDDRKLFEFLVLEGAQAGLSWLTILRKRDEYRKAFDDFDYNKVARYDAIKIERLLENGGIIRNRLKIESVITNAKAMLQVRDEFGSFDKYLWHFVDEKQIKNRWTSLEMVPARTDISDRMSRDMISRGFRFVGSKTCYAYMQATGMVNDHITSCFRYSEI
ncbi:MAG: DNA-3-methyladenine glycosylase I [Candidatus Thermoplasmatota archaeon]|jgi:DNA-3-methyladenine glycosylase I|nr:DNA-3-methyladenine glycosylase I [Candidatus Thermoplasmatota archaeon]MCL6003378.1 DNA-3-methyladenine glycosylase I [Candidatus Thermoplasmatota archaeon]